MFNVLFIVIIVVGKFFFLFDFREIFVLCVEFWGKLKRKVRLSFLFG